MRHTHTHSHSQCKLVAQHKNKEPRNVLKMSARITMAKSIAHFLVMHMGDTHAGLKSFFFHCNLANMNTENRCEVEEKKNAVR